MRINKNLAEKAKAEYRNLNNYIQRKIYEGYGFEELYDNLNGDYARDHRFKFRYITLGCTLIEVSDKIELSPIVDIYEYDDEQIINKLKGININNI